MTTALSKIDPSFIINRQGKPAVLYAGLLDAAHKAGLQHIAVTLLQAPTDDNGNTAICHARAEFEGGRWFEDIGDANAVSVGKMIVPHIIRMAATRAKARTLRDALNINGAAVEEFGPDDEVDPPSTATQQRQAVNPQEQYRPEPSTPEKPVKYTSALPNSAASRVQLDRIRRGLEVLGRPVDEAEIAALTAGKAEQYIRMLEQEWHRKQKAAPATDQVVDVYPPDELASAFPTSARR